MEAPERSPPIAVLKTTETSLQRTMWLAALRWVLAACGSLPNWKLVLSGGPAGVSSRIPLFTVGTMPSRCCHTSLSLWQNRTLPSFHAKTYHSTWLVFCVNVSDEALKRFGVVRCAHPSFIPRYQSNIFKQTQEFVTFLCYRIACLLSKAMLLAPVSLWLYLNPALVSSFTSCWLSQAPYSALRSRGTGGGCKPK